MGRHNLSTTTRLNLLLLLSACPPSSLSFTFDVFVFLIFYLLLPFSLYPAHPSFPSNLISSWLSPPSACLTCLFFYWFPSSSQAQELGQSGDGPGWLQVGDRGLVRCRQRETGRNHQVDLPRHIHRLLQHRIQPWWHGDAAQPVLDGSHTGGQRQGGELPGGPEDAGAAVDSHRQAVRRM